MWIRNDTEEGILGFKKRQDLNNLSIMSCFCVILLGWYIYTFPVQATNQT